MSHEFSVIKGVVDSIINASKEYSAIQITEVHLEIGELTFLAKEQIRFAFQVITRGTVAENAELHLSYISGRIRCSCGFEGETPLSKMDGFHLIFPIIQCPECGNKTEIIKGKECTVKNVKLEVEDV